MPVYKKQTFKLLISFFAIIASHSASAQPNSSLMPNCVSAITSAFPTSGPQNTQVTLSGSGFQTGSGTSQVAFNGIPSVFTVISDSQIQATVPAGNASGPISVVTDSCQSFAPGTFLKLSSTASQNFSSDIYFSEIYDAQAGDGGVIEIYNGTASAVNLSGYSVRRYGDIGGPTFYTINLAGTIPAGGIFLVGIGTGTIPCNISGDQYYSTGFNANDEFQLWKNGVWIDAVHAPTNVGYSVIRKPNVIAPTPTFNANDWDTFTSESCADIGQHDVPQVIPPAAPIPANAIGCENGQASFAVNWSQPGFSFQWKRLTSSGSWVNVPNAAPFSGSQTNVLSISPVPANLDLSQFYCEMTSASATVISHAAQLEVTTATIPNFPISLSICSGASVPILSLVSPNGISGTWNPSQISNAASGNYVFTPDPGQCASAVTLSVNVNSTVVPDFPTSLSICSAASVPSLSLVSPNGISGTWSPSVVSNSANGNYAFTPDPGQCASAVTLSVNVNSTVVPDFPTSLSICSAASVPSLSLVSPNGISGTWNPSQISNAASGNYVFTPDPGQCASAVTLSVNVNGTIVPDFPTSLSICSGASVPSLDLVSPNGISGTWSPSQISSAASGNYVFTPDPGQCASAVTLSVNVNSTVVPDFPTSLSICSGASVPSLGLVSPNGISGTWNPSQISSAASGNYAFTPDSGQCASAVTLSVNVNSTVVPDFPTSLSICSGASVPSLSLVSPNGISGTWSPSVVSNSASGNYVFTPDPGQCASAVTLSVNVNSTVVPDFPTSLSICSGASVPSLGLVSPNGISGTWSPSVVSNSASGNYAFTPDPGQCASAVTLSVNVSSTVVPDFPTSLSICSGASVPSLSLVSPNGISGTWSPSQISNAASGSYVFTPNSNVCAQTVTLQVTLNALPNPILVDGSLCEGHTTGFLLDTGLSDVSYTFQWNLNGSAISGSSSYLAELPGIYTVDVTDLATGCSSSAQATVVEYDGIDVSVQSPQDFSGNGNVFVQASGGSGNYSYLLDAQLQQNDGHFSGLESGEHAVEVTDVDGCDSETVTFYILDYPRFFTPNGDGFHDAWTISGLPNQDAKICIFDRYGKLLKEMNASASGWDGTYNGKELPSSDYWFSIDYTNKAGSKKNFKAHFSLKR